MSESALVVDNVCKKFKKGELYDSLRDLLPALTARFVKGHPESLEGREFWALRDVSFEVDRGEAFGIIGANGAGKSTMLKLLSGIMKPNVGSIHVKGRLSALIEVSAGFHKDLTGRENVFLNGTILGMSRREIQNRFDEIVAFSGLEEFIDTPVKRYSSGMFARLGFAVAAHVNPDILIVDEVLSVGDFAFQGKCLQRMREVIKGGATVVFVSHNLRAVSSLCGRSLLLDRGKVASLGPSERVIRDYLGKGKGQREYAVDKEVFISAITVRGAEGRKNHFQSGETVFVDFDVKSRVGHSGLAVVIDLKDDEFYPVFDTSTQRLGHEPFAVEAGGTVRCTFTLTLHLAPGTYHIGAWLYRYDIQKEYDEWVGAETVFVSTDRDVRGVANLYPEVAIRL